jgi:VanZ family protein
MSRLVVAVGVSLSWAVVDETWQSFVPGRYGSFTDVLLNTLGVGIAAYVAQKRHDASVRA